jgi:hypothetical protein
MKKGITHPVSASLDHRLLNLPLCLGLVAFALAWSLAGELMADGALDAQQAQAEKLVQSIPVTEVLGPLAPIALSPFFALTCLSGSSLLVDAGLLPENALLQGNGVLSNGLVFSGLLGLTVLTSLPKLTKVTKPLAQAVDQVEGYSGIVVALLVQAAASFGTGGGEQVVYQAGVFSFTLSTLLMIVSAVNIFVINTVKFFFEVMVFVSPFPAVDAAFEAANKAFAAALVAVYAYNPTLATALNLGIFAVCLLMFGWVYRRTVYYKAVLGDPVLGFMAESIFRRRKLGPMSTRGPTSVLEGIESPQLVMKVFPVSRMGGIKRKARCYLVAGSGAAQVVWPRFLRSKIVVPVESADPVVEKGFFSNSICWGGEANPTTVVFSRRYNGILGEISSVLGAAGDLEDAKLERPREQMKAMRDMSRKDFKAQLG